jgi:hypothetical protein
MIVSCYEGVIAASDINDRNSVPISRADGSLNNWELRDNPILCVKVKKSI